MSESESGALNIHTVDAFADRPCTGNPAAVVLLDKVHCNTKNVLAVRGLKNSAHKLCGGNV